MQADVKQVRAISTVATDHWDPATLTMLLSNQDIQLIIQETEAGQHPECKDIADHSPMLKSYWAQ
jgi:hypothetical protein